MQGRGSEWLLGRAHRRMVGHENGAFLRLEVVGKGIRPFGSAQLTIRECKIWHMYWPARGRRRDGLRRTASAGRACDSSRACGQTSLRAGAIAWDQGAGIPRSPGETVFPRMPWESWEESSGQMSARKGPQALNLRGKMETARALGFPGGAAHSSNRCAHMGEGSSHIACAEMGLHARRLGRGSEDCVGRQTCARVERTARGACSDGRDHSGLG